MPKTNRRRTTHRKRTSQRKRKRGGAKLGHGWGPYKTPPKYRRHKEPEPSDEIAVHVHLTLIDELGYYFTQSNLANSKNGLPFGNSMVVRTDGMYSPDDIVLPDITLIFPKQSMLYFPRENRYPSDDEIKTYLQTNGIQNVEHLRIITPNNYQNWGGEHNPFLAIRGNCLHGDEAAWLQDNNRANPLYKYTRTEAHPIYT
jgi:hypothetical protein